MIYFSGEFFENTGFLIGLYDDLSRKIFWSLLSIVFEGDGDGGIFQTTNYLIRRLEDGIDSFLFYVAIDGFT
jgi:hypothetical protein